MNVLLVEPNRVLASAYCQVLEQEGHQVAWSQNAQRAIHIADQQKPDVVILELQIVKHNGVAFLYEFRSYSEWKCVPVIIHSMVPPENLRANKKVLSYLGIKDYLYKPTTTLKNLVNAVEQVSVHVA